MFRGRLALLLVIVLLAGSAAVLADGVIHNLQYQLRDDVLNVSFRLRGAIDDDTSKLIQSGAVTSFRYDIELIERRNYWFDSDVTRISLTSSATYDTLTRKYALTLARGEEPISTSTTTSYDQAELWLTSVDQTRVIARAQLQRTARYTLRVRAHLGTRVYFYLIPWEETTPWETVDFNTP